MTKETRKYMGEKSPFDKWYWFNWIATCKRMKLEYSLMLYIKINSKWIKDLNIQPDTVKLLRVKQDNTLYANHSTIFSDLPPRVMTIKQK